MNISICSQVCKTNPSLKQEVHKYFFFLTSASYGSGITYAILTLLQCSSFNYCMHEDTCVLINGFNCVQLFATLWTLAHQAPPSMGFSRQEYWSGLPCHPPGDLPRQGPKLHLTSAAFSSRFFFYHQHHLGSLWSHYFIPSLMSTGFHQSISPLVILLEFKY